MLADHNFWFDHIHPDDAPTIFSSLAQLFVEGERTYEYRFRAASGEYLWMHGHLRLIRDERGAPLEVIGSLSDITARKLLEQEQQQLITRLREAHGRRWRRASTRSTAMRISHSCRKTSATW